MDTTTRTEKQIEQPGPDAMHPGEPGARLPADWAVLFERWVAGGQRRETTESDYRALLTAFCRFYGQRPLAEVQRRDVLGFRDALAADGQSPTTISRKIGMLKTLLRVAIDYEWLTHNPADGVRVASRRDSKARVAFSLGDLQRIFASDIYTADYRPLGGGREAAFWLPLLALYTGARMEELAQLLVSDLRLEPGLGHYFNISDEAAHSKLKNAASRRRIPVHGMLLDCGLLDYVESVRGQGFLFPHLKTNPRDKRGGYFSNFFSGYLRQRVGITDRRKVFHSFRHSFKDVCRSVGIDEAVHDALTGHTAPGAGRKYGNEQYPLPPLFDAIERYEIAGLDLSHLTAGRSVLRVRRSDTSLVSTFYGILVGMPRSLPRQRSAACVHARYQDHEALISVADARLISGGLPAAKHVLVHAWLEIHREELLANWDNARATGAFFRIDPLR